MNFTFKDIPAKENRIINLEAGAKFQDAKIINEKDGSQSNIFVEQYNTADKTRNELIREIQSDSSKALGALFDKVDDGDGIISEEELEILEFITNEYDTNNDDLLSNIEITKIALNADIDKTKETFNMLSCFKDGINAKNAVFLNAINEGNILETMHAYKQLYNNNIEDDIMNSPIDDNLKKQLIDSLTQMTQKAYDYNPNYKAESKIENQYYTGGSYDILQNGDNMEITNKETGEKTSVDLEKMCEGLSIEQKVKIKKAMQTIPAELILDMYDEVNFKSTSQYGKTRSAYSSGLDAILLSEKFDQHAYDGARYTFAHETGHALDYSKAYTSFNSSFCQNNEDINEIYKKEMENYINNGGEKYEEVKNELGGYTKISGAGAETYVTWNIKEMFAESYCMLMLGKAPSEKCILENFPETFEAIKNHLDDMRNLPADKKRAGAHPSLLRQAK